jgi:hypothetical protein
LTLALSSTARIICLIAPTAVLHIVDLTYSTETDQITGFRGAIIIKGTVN